MHLFQEENIRRGRIEVICGSMFSGKTEELIRRLKRARIARQRVEIYKPNIDTRYSDEDVVSHDRNTIPSTPVEAAASILLLAGEAEVVGIDEAQFFDDGLVEVCNNLANSGKRVIVAGLDMDFKGIPFGPVPALCAIAEDVTKVHAVVSAAVPSLMSVIAPLQTAVWLCWVNRPNMNHCAGLVIGN